MKDEFLSIIMECAASIVNEKNSENSLLRDECGETLYGQVLTQLTNAIANLLSSIWIKEYSEARNNHIINDSTVESRFSHFRKLSTTKKYRKYIFDKYELLENDVDQYINNYYDMIGEIVQSYKKDKADLENHFNFIYGKMIAIHSGMGDTHNGKNVCEVEFENGTLFYKPRACLTDRFFEELLTIVSPQSIENNQTDFWGDTTHSWHRPIIYQMANNISAVKNYYYRAGVYLAVMYLCSSTDMHSENVVCCMDSPRIIDCETVVSAQKHNFEQNQIGKTLESSVLQSRMLPVNLPTDVFDYDVSGLFAETMKSNKIKVPMIVDDVELDIKYKYVLVNETPKLSALHSKLGCAQEKDVIGMLLAGFNAGCTEIIKRKNSVLQVVSDPQYSKMKVRQLLRPTYTYSKFIDESHKPCCERTKENREALFDILRENFKSDAKYGTTRLEYEISEMKRGNIPIFYSEFCKNDLFADGRIICPGYYQFSAKETILEKLLHLDETTIKYQERLIAMSIFLHSANLDPSNTIHNFDNIFYINGYDNYTTEYLEASKEWCEEFLKYLKISECPVDSTHASMIIPTAIEDTQTPACLSTICPDFYAQGGIIFYILAYAKVFSKLEDKLYADRLLENAKDALKNPSKIAEKNAFSLYGFWGSSLYIKYNEYLMFDDKTDYACVFDLIKTIIDKLLQQRFENAENDFDFMHGFSGTIYLLAEILRNDNKIFITFFDDFDYISRKYIDTFFYSFLNGTFSEIGFAHGISGNIATVAMISKLIPIDYNKLEQCIKADDHMFKESSEHSCLPSWCNGIAGQILARVIGYTATLNKSTKEVFESSLNSYLEEKYLNVLLSCKQLCLCHGVYGVASVLNYLKDNSKQKKSFPNIYLNVNPMSIQWVNGISYPYESFMTGITGVLYEHLRLINHNIPNTLAAGLYGVEL